MFSVGSARASRAVFGAIAEHTVRPAGYVYSEVFDLKPTSSNTPLRFKNRAHLLQIGFVLMVSADTARATERGLQSAGVLVSEGGFGILRARLCGAHVPAG